MKHFDAAAVRAALPFPVVIEALRAMFATGCQVPLRHTHQVEGFTSLIMPAWTARHYGVKVINIAPGNAARGLPGLHASYLLHDAATGVPLALLDGDEITARRTVGASALAASHLAREDASHLLVVGAGRLARWLPAAFAAVRPITHVSVWARAPQQAQALAAQLQADGFEAEPAGDLAAACAQADIVSCATLATAPVVHGAWLRPGSHLDLIGSFSPAMRETDDACFVDASLYVDTPEALQKSGDLLGPLSRGIFKPEDLRGTLESLVRGSSTGRRSASERTVFKAVGTALEDLAAAVAVVEAAG
ncbi:ornithine cyclodeaminase family protein [Pseudorhodoferax sp. Leaf267]|uniref:ornithine cyclodeaminase family protein n=1 Tax=Pseudorhodoferax sp. Leaf267 TaxID=1736316 RepID=UPI0006FBD90B|nr:ornithine cyclodeaminase family protein [Pseudorhodoferax sp. Leaf267]KQP22582.1 ornithine cyclodeaminase [Pseudorhodoferax sp. Leaf267]